MRKIKIGIVKIIAFLLRCMGRGGSLPGTLWLKLDSDVLKSIEYPSTVILISGTNGKTTTTNLIYEMCKKNYNRVICNDKGDNMLIGVASLILNNLKGNRVNADAMVLEVDELSLPRIYENINVSHIVILNLFRDQLDRSGEMENIINKFENTLKDYSGKLILNSSDPNVYRLSRRALKATVSSFEVVVDNMDNGVLEAKEGRFCPFCNNELEYDYYLYAHIGKYKCSNCDFNNTQVDYTYIFNDKIIYKGIEFEVNSSSLYSIYNYAALLSVSNVLGFDINKCKDIIKNYSINKGRNERFTYKGKEVILNLVKNPTGCNEVLKEISKDCRTKDVVFILNDNDNDGNDISWIYDTKFEYIYDFTLNIFMCSGIRGYDLALRLYYGDCDKIEVNLEYKQAIDSFDSNDNVLYVLSTYSNIVKTRSYLERKSK